MKVMPDAWYQRLETITNKPAPEVSDVPGLVTLYAQLSEAGDDPESEMQQIEGLVVYQIGPPAIPVLFQLAKSSSEPEERGSALYMLCIYRLQKSDEIADAVHAAMRDEHETVRQSAMMLWDSLLDKD